VEAQLTPEQYAIARAHGTERPFCGTLLDNKQTGVYSCICCGLPLFASNAKFDSGTGWPSFFQPIADENVATKARSQLRGVARRDPRARGAIAISATCSWTAAADAAAALREFGVARVYRRRGAFFARRPRRAVAVFFFGVAVVDFFLAVSAKPLATAECRAAIAWSG
jgi:hypothetical protein